MLIGAHVSTEGGLSTAFDRADEDGCDTFQIFTKNKGAWAAKPLTVEQIKSFRERASAPPRKPVFAHAAYLINIASPAAALNEKSLAALRIELERCEALGIDGLVLHPGSHSDTSEDEGLQRAAAALDEIHRTTPGFRAKILLENSAGQGSSVCSRLGSLGKLLRSVKEPHRLGVCIDTCHLFAAGYDLRSRATHAAVMAELEDEIGSEKVLCIHLNDSKKELGSRVDRHEHLGKGLLGLEGIGRILRDRRFAHAPFIFELPPENGMIRKNLAVLRRILKPGRTRSKKQ